MGLCFNYMFWHDPYFNRKERNGMSYVQPNSVIQLFKGINLDNRYMHTIYFASVSAQNTWFASKVYKAYQQQSYTRYTRNQIKLKADATEIMDCTYLRFMNDRTTDMWYYAFINSIEYINENVALITYEIDVMQTWFIQKGSVRPCLVRREHANSDIPFDNLEDEPIGSDAYEYDFLSDCNTLDQYTDCFTNYSVLINSTGKPNTQQGDDYYVSGIFNGTRYQSVECNNSTQAENVLTTLNNMIGNWDEEQQRENILNMCMFPTRFATGALTDSPVSRLKNVSISTAFHGKNLEGADVTYTPKNKKLYNYPFAFLYCTTHNGTGNFYRLEYFNNYSTSSIQPKVFNIIGSPMGGGEIKCYPRNYQGVVDNISEGLSISDFPKCAFNYDAYEAWVAAGGKTRLQNEQTLTYLRSATGVVSSAANMATNIASGGYNIASGITSGNIAQTSSGIGQIVQSSANVVNAGINMIEAINKINYEWKDASYRPNIPVGTSEPSIMGGDRRLNFYFYEAHIKLTEIVRIDDFLSCYGYATNKVKTPNLTGRTYWNFVQTENCVIAGNMPASSKEAIARIFDGGITFWHNGDNVGNYAISTSNGSINNPITS